MPQGRTKRSPKAGPGHQTKNAMVILDPATWQPIKVYKMRELDEYPRVPCANVGYEDMRIFRTDRGGLQGIAASLHLKRETKAAAGGAQHQPPEQVLLSFDSEYNIVKAQPIRGDWWSGTAQKNWSPFTDCAEPRFLYAINKGTLFDDRGVLRGADAVVRLSEHARPFTALSAPAPVVEIPAEPPPPELVPEPEKVKEKKPHADPRTRLGGGSGDVRVRGRRVSHDSITTRPTQSAAFMITRTGKVSSETSTRVLGTGRSLMPRYEGLRGGTQLVWVAEDTWLGIGHEMRYENGLKFYHHTWYTTDSRGKLTAASEQMKLAPEVGIEFAAGLAIDGDRVVVSYGLEDMKSNLGETSLSAVLEMLAKKRL